MKNQTYEKIMKLLAGESGLTYDGGYDDNRLFYQESETRVFAECMSVKAYDKMEKDLAKKEIKGKGYTVSAWNDCSGYSYWAENEGESNYIQVTAYITDFNLVDTEKLKADIEKLELYFSKYDNADDFYEKQYQDAKNA